MTALRSLMFQLIQKPFTASEWTALTSQFDDLSLMQTWEYGEALASTGPWKIDRAVFEDDGVPIGAIQAVIRRVPLVRAGFAWVNRGPLCRKSDAAGPEQLGPMMSEARSLWAERQHLYLRIAPPVSKPEWDSIASNDPGYSPSREGNGWVSSRLDLTVDLGLIRQRLDKRWRNSLSNAERREVTVRRDSNESFKQFLRLQRGEFALHSYPTTVTPKFLVALQSFLPTERRLLAFVATSGESLLGAVLIARYGSIGEFLAGVIEGAGRTANVGQLLIWQAIQHLKESGYRWFDLGGMDPDHTEPGIINFKAGLSGQPYEYVGEFDAIGSGWANRIVRWRVRRVRRVRRRVA